MAGVARITGGNRGRGFETAQRASVREVAQRVRDGLDILVDRDGAVP